MPAPMIHQRHVPADDAGVRTESAAVMANGVTVFNVIGAPILLTRLASYSTTANDGTASTLQWAADGDVGAEVQFTGASASLASLAPGAAVVANLTALTTPPDVLVNGVGLASVTSRGIIIPPGIIRMLIGTGPTTGRWQHFLSFAPLSTQARVLPAF